MKVDMSAKAVTRRLRQTEELRRLCLALGYKRYTDFKKITFIRSPKPAKK